jgi:hypothetical protein
LRSLLLAILFVWTTGPLAAAVALVSEGVTKCCVVVGREEAFKEPESANWSPRTTLLKWAAEDVANYLGRMSGAKVSLGEKPVEGLLPIYVGCAPEEVKLSKTTEFGDAYIVDVSGKRIILHGESRRAVYYAATTLLQDLGVRWYAPGEIGEVVPSRATIEVPSERREYAPDFITRRIWCRPPDELRWMYRNRLGDPLLPCGHSLHGYGAKLPGWHETGVPVLESRAKYPEYYAVVDGKTGGFINLANPDIPRIFAQKAIELSREQPRRGQGGKRARGFLSISPDDGFLRDERPEVVAMNSPGREPILGMPSFSDAWFGFLNRVCAEVEKQVPDLEFRFGSLAYMNYILPPKRIKPDPRIVPVIAPITFNRYVSMGTPGAPTSEQLEEIVKGWTAISPRVGMYLYSFNLADMAMPYTRRVHWTNDFPKLFKLGIRDMTVESHPNWHTLTPGNYVAARLLWDVKTDVKVLLDEYYPAYYGPAAEAMRRYDTTLENAYESTRVFAGGVWGMHRILTGEVMQKLEQALADAEERVKGKGVFEQRVETVRFSLNFAKCWFAARDALNRFDLAEAEKQGAAFIANYQAGYVKYPDFFGKNVSWSPNIERYFELFHNKTFKDAGRIAREGTVVYKLPDQWWVHLETVEGDATPSGKMPDLQKDEWWRMRTFSSTLDEQGLTFFRGVLWYRHEFKLPKTAMALKTLKLWFGGVDTRVHVWLNGKDLGEKMVSTGPYEIDISGTVDRTEINFLMVSVDNTFPNEIGTGGIVRPALIYAPGQ